MKKKREKAVGRIYMYLRIERRTRQKEHTKKKEITSFIERHAVVTFDLGKNVVMTK